MGDIQMLFHGLLESLGVCCVFSNGIFTIFFLGEERNPSCHCDTFASIVMRTLLMKSIRCCDTKIMHIELVTAEIYSINYEHIIFEQKSQKGGPGGRGSIVLKDPFFLLVR